MKLIIDDINFNGTGFICQKIKRATDNKLLKLDEKLAAIGKKIDWSNIDDFGFLSVSYYEFDYLYNDKGNQQNICNILNKLFKL